MIEAGVALRKLTGRVRMICSNKKNHFERLDLNINREVSSFLSHGDVMAVSEVSKSTHDVYTEHPNNRIKSIKTGKAETCQKNHNSLPRSQQREMMNAALREQKKEFYSKISTNYCQEQFLITPLASIGSGCALGSAIGLWGGFFSMCCPYSCEAVGLATGWAAAGVAGVFCVGGTVVATATLVSDCMETLPPPDMRQTVEPQEIER